MALEYRYHPDSDIDKELHKEAFDAEKADLAAGYPPRKWQCQCGASHSRGHFLTIGYHRCFNCGYVGDGGTYIGPT